LNVPELPVDRLILIVEAPPPAQVIVNTSVVVTAVPEYGGNARPLEVYVQV
jgi:hypothetical protein